MSVTEDRKTAKEMKKDATGVLNALTQLNIDGSTDLTHTLGIYKLTRELNRIAESDGKSVPAPIGDNVLDMLDRTVMNLKMIGYEEEKLEKGRGEKHFLTARRFTNMMSGVILKSPLFEQVSSLNHDKSLER